MARVLRLDRVVASAFASDATGIKISCTAPAQNAAAGGRFRKIIGFSWYNISGTPTVQAQLVTAAAVTLVLGSGNSSTPPGDWGGTQLVLRPGETFQANITGAAAGGSTATAVISFEEWSCT